MTGVSVCIATHRRPQQLRLLLADLCAQTRLPDEVIVVDNDAQGSAAEVLAKCRAAGLPFVLRTAMQPVKNIALTRNATVALARGEWLAFIDDDERAPADWLERLTASAGSERADAVLGPVLPVLPASAPRWLQRGHFYDWPRQRSGTVVPLNRLRFGNVLIRTSWLRAQAGPFDPAYGLTGGEDGDLLARLAAAGARIVWCDEAVVHEPVEPARQTLCWLLLRALRGGQDYVRHAFNGRYGADSGARRVLLLLRSTAQLLVATTLSLLTWPAGRHYGAFWLVKAAANLGKLSGFARLHYREYD